jgi:hypothetical protein
VGNGLVDQGSSRGRDVFAGSFEEWTLGVYGALSRNGLMMASPPKVRPCEIMPYLRVYPDVVVADPTPACIV